VLSVLPSILGLVVAGLALLGDDFVGGRRAGWPPVVYGREGSWARDVLTAGAATIDLEGERQMVDRPELVPIADVADAFSASDRSCQRLPAAGECLLLDRAMPHDGGERVAD
jgi:hypothetical protein